MIWKRGKFRGSSKNSQHWSWDDVRCQTVPEAASGHLKYTSPTVDSHVHRITSCEVDDDRRQQRLESTLRW